MEVSGECDQRFGEWKASGKAKAFQCHQGKQKWFALPSRAAMVSIGVHAIMVLSVGTVAVRRGEGTPARVDMTVFLGDRMPKVQAEPIAPIPDVMSFSIPQEIGAAAPLVPPPPPATAPEPPVISSTSKVISASATALPRPQSGKSAASRPPGRSSSPANTAGNSGRTAGKGSDARPLASKNAPPRYPEMARRSGWQGVVLVRVTVLPDGRVGSASIFRGSGYAILDQSALDAVRRWLFQPKMSSGLAVESTIEVPVTFSLRKV